MSEPDRRYMDLALDLATAGRGFVEPNPLVGAVLVKRDRVIGKGFHQKFGGPHAEIDALESATADTAGSTLYVTLEPCCHHGKTPPCTDAVIRAGISRVVMAMADPFPAVSGKGARLLQEAGIDVSVGVGEAEARALNAPYLKLISTGKPYVHAKWAMTLDGRIATATAESKWITGEDARRHAHLFRGQVDAIIAGIGTILADDPLLTARPQGARTATRIVLDSKLRCPPGAQLVQTAKEIPTLIATTAAASESLMKQLQSFGCECIILPSNQEGRVDIPSLLAILGNRRFTNVLVEGGAGALGAFLGAGAIDAARVYVSGKIVGGHNALGPVGGVGIGPLADALNLGPLCSLTVGDDLFLSVRRAY